MSEESKGADTMNQGMACVDLGKPGEANGTRSKACDADNKPSLQDAFKRFKQRRKQEIKRTKKLEKDAAKIKRTPKMKEQLRQRFLKQVLKYQGVPYHRKYHQDPKGKFYNAPLYLDCCGLVRRAQRDLARDFGFRLGKWNQAYQFDTLPIEVTKEEMKPGDLVFISGTYYSPRSKRQKHDMVHVEVWLGDGEKTVGARHQRGVVQIHDSYEFESKSYYNMKYYFRSIDTWLDGVCKSFCEEHEWKAGPSRKPVKSRYSIFRQQQQQQQSSASSRASSCDASQQQQQQEQRGGNGTSERKQQRKRPSFQGNAQRRSASSGCGNRFSSSSRSPSSSTTVRQPTRKSKCRSSSPALRSAQSARAASSSSLSTAETAARRRTSLNVAVKTLTLGNEHLDGDNAEADNKPKSAGSASPPRVAQGPHRESTHGRGHRGNDGRGSRTPPATAAARKGSRSPAHRKVRSRTP